MHKRKLSRFKVGQMLADGRQPNAQLDLSRRKAAAVNNRLEYLQQPKVYVA